MGNVPHVLAVADSALNICAEYNRIRAHRDLVLEQLRVRKKICAEQERAIQRIAEDRRALREKVDELERTVKGNRDAPSPSSVALPCYKGTTRTINRYDDVSWDGLFGVVEDVSFSYLKGWHAHVHIGSGVVATVPTSKLEIMRSI